jgi:Flp pilus assembly protein CpaB
MGGGNRAKTVVVFSFFGVVIFVLVAFSFLYVPPKKEEIVKTVIEKEVVQAPLEMVDVLVPIQKIEGGAGLEPIMFRKEKRPKIAVTDRVIRDFDQIKGFYSRSVIYPDQPLVNDYITQIKPVNSITASIPVGFRAVTFTVTATTSVEGWAKAGARVDVAWGSVIRGQHAITVIVQNAKIISADRQVEGAPPNPDAPPVPTTVTLLVSAKDAQKISLASALGPLSLHLRGDNDGEKQATLIGSLTAKDLLGDGIDDNDKDEAIDGSVKMLDPDGTYKEWVVKDGKLVRREISF